MKPPFFTIGHTNRTLEDFLELLNGAQIAFVVDIRTVPRSRVNPQFNRDALSKAMAGFGISYEHIAALGGLRGKARTSSQDVNGVWTNQSFHNYADYALTPTIPEGPRTSPRCGAQAALHDNVFGGRMVALSPPHRRGPSHRQWGNRAAYYRTSQRA